ncbi:MAG TPA: sulfotransferase domain-containing protein [Rhabdochlamydiaceae bacterium]
MGYGLEPVAEGEYGPFLGEWNRKIYLATYPRSGNHWLRYLIEEVTQIATSSVYCDADEGKSHLGKPFPWGGYSPKFGYEGKCRYPYPYEVVVIKTHFPAVPAQKFDRMSYVKAIRIVRNPIDSLYSFYVFNKKQRLGSRMSGELLEKRIRSWRKFHEYWNAQSNVVTIRYEDMLKDPLPCLQTVFSAMGYAFSDEQLQKAIEKYPPKGAPLKHIAYFAPEDLSLIQSELGDLMQQFEYEKMRSL